MNFESRLEFLQDSIIMGSTLNREDKNQNNGNMISKISNTKQSTYDNSQLEKKTEASKTKNLKY